MSTLSALGLCLFVYLRLERAYKENGREDALLRVFVLLRGDTVHDISFLRHQKMSKKFNPVHRSFLVNAAKCLPFILIMSETAISLIRLVALKVYSDLFWQQVWHRIWKSFVPFWKKEAYKIKTRRALQLLFLLFGLFDFRGQTMRNGCVCVCFFCFCFFLILSPCGLWPQAKFTYSCSPSYQRSSKASLGTCQPISL